MCVISYTLYISVKIHKLLYGVLSPGLSAMTFQNRDIRSHRGTHPRVKKDGVQLTHERSAPPHSRVTSCLEVYSEDQLVL